MGLALLGTAAVAADPVQPAAPHLLALDGVALAGSKAKLHAGDAALRPALEALRREADAALTIGPFSVMDKTKVPPSGNKHDYLSRAPYWWPDPKKPDGLPYISKDGELNPDSRVGTDRQPLQSMIEAVDTLALAYYFTEHQPYAERATLLLRTWFLDDATRMNPHLNYGQGVPGHIDGRGTGIIDTADLIRICDAVGLLAGSPAWTAADQQGMVRWFAAYLDWLRTSPIGKEEGRARNNHATWYDAQVVCFALFSNQPAIAKEVAEAAKARLITTQIEPDGRQPLELARTRPLHYSRFNLLAYCTLARLATQVKVDLWQYRTADGRGIRPALEWLTPYLLGKAQFARKEVVALPVPYISGLRLLRQAGYVYQHEAFTSAAAALPGVTPDLLAADRSTLLYPPVTAK